MDIWYIREDVEEIASRLGTIMTATEEERAAMGSNSRKFVREWGPGRFAYGLQCAAKSRGPDLRASARVDHLGWYAGILVVAACNSTELEIARGYC